MGGWVAGKGGQKRREQKNENIEPNSSQFMFSSQSLNSVRCQDVERTRKDVPQAFRVERETTRGTCQ